MIIFWIISVTVVKQNFIANPCTIKKVLKTKIRSYRDEATNFHAWNIPGAGSNYICWSVILIDSVLKKDENYYSLKFLK